MKYSIFTVMAPGCTVEQIGEKLQAHGYDGVEWRVGRRVEEEPQPLPARAQWYWEYNRATLNLEDIEKEAVWAAAVCERNGLEKVSLASYLMPAQLADIERLLEAAKHNGFQMIRLFPDKYTGAEPYPRMMERVRGELREVERMARRCGVRVTLEIHMDTIIPSASAACRLLEGMDEELLGVVYDAGNMVYEGYEQYQMGLEMLGARVHHVHLKDARVLPCAGGGYAASFCRIGEGQVRFDKLFDALKKQGYAGYLSFEDFSAPHEEDEKLARNLAYIKTIWEESGFRPL